MSKVDSIMDETEDPNIPPPTSVTGGSSESAEARPARRDRAGSAPRAGAVARLGQFIRDVRAELKRVSWPSATEVKNTTIITLVAVVFFASYLFAVDLALGKLITGLGYLINKI